MTSFYQKIDLVKRIISYLRNYTDQLTKPTARKYLTIVFAFLMLQSMQSIRFAHQWLMSWLSPVSLNAYYHFFNGSKLHLKSLETQTVRLALQIIPESLKSKPIFLLIDDTLQEKYGTHFENAALLFDHAAHNGSNYLKGHAFTALSLSVPVGRDENGKLHYLCVPVSYQQATKEQTKLKQLAEEIAYFLPHLSHRQVILLCDSWYPKKEILEVVRQNSCLEMIANVRSDTALFKVPKHSGRRGRPAIYGDKITWWLDFQFESVHNYQIGYQQVRTRLFKDKNVYAFGTLKGQSKRLFLSTIAPEQILMMQEDRPDTSFFKENQLTPKQKRTYLPLILYGIRWQIEVQFQQQKTFWSFGNYQLRSKVGVETYLHMMNVSYTSLLLLPYLDQKFSFLKNESAQNRKLIVAHQLNQAIFLTRFVSRFETMINTSRIIQAFNSFWYKQT